jgi:hypothetical protein
MCKPHTYTHLLTFVALVIICKVGKSEVIISILAGEMNKRKAVQFRKRNLGVLALNPVLFLPYHQRLGFQVSVT